MNKKQIHPHHLKKHHRDPMHIDALKRLHHLLLQGGIEIVDTPIELEFLLKHCNSPIDTLAEINRERFVGKLENYEKEIDAKHEPELKKEMTDIIQILKAPPRSLPNHDKQQHQEEHHYDSPRPGR